jgi:hypothetical protein
MVPADEQNWVSPGTGAAPVVTGADAPPTTDTTDPTDTAGSSGTADELAAGADAGVATDR